MVLDSLAPDTARKYLTSLAALVTAPKRTVRGSSLSLLACQYGASEEEARQWHWEFGSQECVDPQQVI